MRPSRQPVDRAAADEGWEIADAVSEAAADGAHGDYNVQLQATSLDEEFFQLLPRPLIMQSLQALPLGHRSQPFRDLHPVVGREEIGHCVGIQQIVQVSKNEISNLKFGVRDEKYATLSRLACPDESAF